MRYIAESKLDAIRMDGGWRFRWEDVGRLFGAVFGTIPVRASVEVALVVLAS
jgi:hypothetical protein